MIHKIKASFNYSNILFVTVDFAYLFIPDIIWSYTVPVAENRVTVSDIRLLSSELISPSI